MSKVWLADLQILGSAFFFGIGFIGQRAVSVEGLGPMTCNALRFALSALLLVVTLPFLPSKLFSSDDSTDKEKGDDDDDNHSSTVDISSGPSYWPKFLLQLTPLYSTATQKSVLHWGIFLGCINFMGSGLQQVGITMTAANKVAFIAGFDLFLTPIFSLFIPTFKKNGKPSPSVWLAVGVSIFGLYMLSNANILELSIIGGRGEFICLVSTIFWTLHITYTDIATSYVDCLHMMCVQLSVVSMLSGIAAVMFEPQGWFWHHVLMFVPWMLFLAVVEGLGFTLMAMGQHMSPPTHAAILLSLEGVFASVASYLFLGETLSSRELTGCVLMLCATMIAKLGCCHLDFAVAEAEKAMNSSNQSFLSSTGGSLSTLETGSLSSGMINSTAQTAPVSCAARVKAFVTVPAIMLRETMANFRFNVANTINNFGWCVASSKVLLQWFLSSCQRWQNAATSNLNSASIGMSPLSNQSMPVSSSSFSSTILPSVGRQDRDQHIPLISRESVSISNFKI